MTRFIASEEKYVTDEVIRYASIDVITHIENDLKSRLVEVGVAPEAITLVSVHEVLWEDEDGTPVWGQHIRAWGHIE